MQEIESFTQFIVNLVSSEYFIEMLLKVLIFPGLVFVLLFVLLAVWFERKFLAKVHLRIGPLHVGPGPFGGLFQPFADALKLLQKEIIVPYNAHKFLYNLGPLIMPMVPLAAMAFIPVAPYPSVLPVKYLVIFYTEYSLLVVLALFAVSPLIIIGIGWASGSKYTTMGALRAAYQLLAYEVPLVLSIAGVVMVAGSFDLIQIVESQSNLWFIGLLPIGFLVFFVSVMAELGRRPFDVPHAEQEIVYGWATEFTGVHYLLVMMAEYVHFCIGSVLITLLFLGGWHGAYLPPAAWFLIKFGIVTILIIMGRGVYPRFRIDQLLNVGWRILIPLALIQILIIFCLAKFAPWIIPAMR
jgi:NADH-quinone oxidoreductase subunit H